MVKSQIGGFACGSKKMTTTHTRQKKLEKRGEGVGWVGWLAGHLSDWLSGRLSVCLTACLKGQWY